MKKVQLIIALFISAAVMFSCKDKDKKPTPPPTPTEKKVDLADILTANEIQSLTASLSANETMRGKPVKLPKTVTVSAATMTLANNGGGSFGINYGGATDVLSHFFRGGDSLGVSGNVYPTASLQYSASITSWTATFSRTYYQSLVVTGTMERDANGVLGAGWVFSYTNVVN